MKKLIVAAVLVAVAAPALAQNGNGQVRLAKLEEIVVTADKAQPAGYTPDAKTAALLAEIAKAK
jgi:uncharacterized protein YdeI (BOF family)